MLGFHIWKFVDPALLTVIAPVNPAADNVMLCDDDVMPAGLEKVSVVGVAEITGFNAVPVSVIVALVAPVLANVIVPDDDPALAGAVKRVNML